MRPITISSTQNLESITEGHVYYLFQDKDVYLGHLLSFIETGIQNHQNILIVESMKNLPKIKAEIKQRFSEEQQACIRVVNNFDYYFSGGDFNTETIVTHFSKDLTLLKKDNRAVRTWAHVEWASAEPDADQLATYEATADDFVQNAHMLSICAYSSNSITPVLHAALEQVHNYVMKDDSFTLSNIYKRA